MKVIMNDKEKKSMAASGVFVAVFVAFVCGMTVDNYGAKRKARMQRARYAAKIESLQADLDAATADETTDGRKVFTPAPLACSGR